MSYDNANSGSLFKNERKMSERHPDYRGQINVDGRDYWLSAWLKEGKAGSKIAGQKFFSISVSPKEQTQHQQPPKRQAPTERQMANQTDGPEEDVPF